MVGLIRTFCAKVRVCQRAYRRLRVMREARIKMIQPFFSIACRDVRAHMKRCDGLSEAASADHKRAIIEARRGSTVRDLKKMANPLVLPPRGVSSEEEVDISPDSRSSRISEGDRTLTLTTPDLGNVFALTSLGGDSVASMDDLNTADVPKLSLSENEELFPKVVTHLALKEYVIEMQRSHRGRMESWLAQREELDFHSDIQRFVAGDDNVADKQIVPRPMPFYIEMVEIEELAFRTLRRWNAGEFKHVMQNQHRLLKKMINFWLESMGKALPPMSKRGFSNRKTVRHHHHHHAGHGSHKMRAPRTKPRLGGVPEATDMGADPSS